MLNRFMFTSSRFLAALCVGLVLLLSIVGARAQNLSPSQLQTLKNAINANPTWSAYPMGSDGYFALAKVLNATAVPTFVVWRTDAPVANIIDSITWANYTPNDAVGSSDTDPLLSRKIGWLLTSQTKQMNLQLMLQGRDTLNCSKATLRAGLRDAVILVPTGTGGANTSPGGASGVTVLTACTRSATEAEKILAGPSEQTGTVTANVLGFEGALTAQDVEAARQLP